MANPLHFWHYVSALPLCIYAGLIYSCIFFNKLYGKDLLFLLALDLFVKSIKTITNFFPKYSWMYQNTRRPQGATCTDYLSRNFSDNSSKSGFPSGHVATTAAFCTLVYLCYPSNLNITSSLSVCFLCILLVGLSRYIKKCHSFFQILAGVWLGVTASYMYILQLRE